MTGFIPKPEAVDKLLKSLMTPEEIEAEAIRVAGFGAKFGATVEQIERHITHNQNHGASYVSAEDLENPGIADLQACRAARFELLVRTHIEHHPEPDYGCTYSATEVLADILADMRHYCDKHGITAQSAWRLASQWYVDEVDEEATK